MTIPKVETESAIQKIARLELRVEELERALGLNAVQIIPLRFKLKASEEQIMCLLMKREVVAYEGALAVLNSRRGAKSDANTVNVHICHLRARLANFGIKIETKRGGHGETGGYYLTPEMKGIIRAIAKDDSEQSLRGWDDNTESPHGGTTGHSSRPS